MLSKATKCKILAQYCVGGGYLLQRFHPPVTRPILPIVIVNFLRPQVDVRLGRSSFGSPKVACNQVVGVHRKKDQLSRSLCRVCRRITGINSNSGYCGAYSVGLCRFQVDNLLEIC